MKIAKMKTMCTFCAAVLTLGTVPAFPAAAEIPFYDGEYVSNADFGHRYKPNPKLQIMGDTNGDECVSVDDAQSVLLRYVQSVADDTAIPSEELPSADTNFDGVIDIIDASNILRYYCRTLVGDVPLWSEFRSMSEVTGKEVPVYETVDYVTEEGEEYTATIQTGTKFLSYGKTGMFLEIGAVSAKPGECVSVPVYISGVPLLAGFQLFVTNPDLVVKEVRPLPNAEQYGGSFMNNSLLPSWGDGYGGAVWVAPASRDVVFQNGSVITELVYQIPEDATPGTVYPLNILRSETKFVSSGREIPREVIYEDPNANSYRFTVLNGCIKVE